MRKYRLLLCCVLLLGFSCGLNNTMYNARKYFNDAKSRPLTANGRPSSQAVDEYTKAIKKCGIILSNKKRNAKTDDALYLMAQALYLKGNSAFQAKDQFEALIAGFPDSPFYGESHIWLARVLREINQPEQAEDLLEDFIRDPLQKKLHPKALLTLADFEIKDKDYHRAQYWLEKIITDYPKSREYREAHFLFGKNYYDQQEYPASLQEFEKIIDSRNISKEMKLDAKYYAALNLYELKRYDEGLKLVRKLLKDEYRPESISQASVLRVRLLFATGQDEEALKLAENVSKDYPRTASSAANQYFLGEYYFYRLGDLEKAGVAYNKVRSELVGSPYSEISQRKNTAVNQLKQGSGVNPRAGLQEYLDYHLAAAENYLSPFDLPDSALMLYQRLIDSQAGIQAEHDSLFLLLPGLEAELDSLSLLLSELALQDSLDAEKADEQPELETTLAADSLAVADSLFTQLDAEQAADSTAVASEPDKQELEVLEPDIPPADSLAAGLEGGQEPKPEFAAERRRKLEAEKAALQTRINQCGTRLEDLAEMLRRYSAEIIPMAMFSKASIHNRRGGQQERVQEIYAGMEEQDPRSKYTTALASVLRGEPARLIDPEEDAEEKALDHALGLSEAAPDSMVAILGGLTESQYHSVKLRANFRLGWYYTFAAGDTARARPYLEEVLKLEQSGDYASLTRRFFNGKDFSLNQDLLERWQAAAKSSAAADTLAAVDDSLKAQEEEKGSADQNPELIQDQSAQDGGKAPAVDDDIPTETPEEPITAPEPVEAPSDKQTEPQE